jgi:hypothetical protein
MPDERDERDERDPKVHWRWAVRAIRPWIGWVSIGLGALLILLGYLGVSGEATVAKQIPYLVSGGIGGLFLCIVGVYLLGAEELRKGSGRDDHVARLVEELHAVLLTRPDAPSSDAGIDASGNGASSDAVLAVRGGESFHRQGCPMVADKDAEELTVEIARSRGLSPCPLCEPASASV